MKSNASSLICPTRFESLTPHASINLRVAIGDVVSSFSKISASIFHHRHTAGFINARQAINPNFIILGLSHRVLCNLATSRALPHEMQSAIAIPFSEVVKTLCVAFAFRVLAHSVMPSFSFSSTAVDALLDRLG